MTIVGLENELNSQTTPMSIADTWTLESEHFDKDTLLATIVTTGGSFEPLYSDPFYYRTMCGFWWKRWAPTFDRWFEMMFDKDYEPIWNKDAYKEIHEDTVDDGNEKTEFESSVVVDDDTTYSKKGKDTTVVDRDTTFEETHEDEEQLSGTDSTEHESSRDIDSEVRVSAYDSSSYSPHDSNHTDDDLTKDDTDITYGKKTAKDGTSDGSGTEDVTTTKNWEESGSGTDDSTTTTDGSSSTNKGNDRDFDHSSHEWGNIGLTTTQQLIQAENELRLKWGDLYRHMADAFIKEMTIYVW